MSESKDTVTTVLLEMQQRGETSDERLDPILYDELRRIAGDLMRKERVAHTLQATALVNEAYLRLVRDRDMNWRSRRHFFGAAAEAMRRVLVDHARKVRSEKRGGDRGRVTFTVIELVEDGDPERLLALDDALDRLETEDPRAAEVARLRFFAGLSVDDTAQAIGVSQRTVMREWTFARARLAEMLGGEA